MSVGESLAVGGLAGDRKGEEGAREGAREGETSNRSDLHFFLLPDRHFAMAEWLSRSSSRPLLSSLSHWRGTTIKPTSMDDTKGARTRTAHTDRPRTDATGMDVGLIRGMDPWMQACNMPDIVPAPKE